MSYYGDYRDEYEQGKKDERNHRFDYEHDRYSGRERDEAYFKGREEEHRYQERRDEERREEERQERLTQKRAEERQQEEYDQYQQYLERQEKEAG